MKNQENKVSRSEYRWTNLIKRAAEISRRFCTSRNARVTGRIRVYLPRFARYPRHPSQ